MLQYMGKDSCNYSFYKALYFAEAFSISQNDDLPIATSFFNKAQLSISSKLPY